MSTQLTDQRFPALAAWVEDGTLEIGFASYDQAFIRLLDEGGTVWTGKRRYPSLDAALEEANAAAQKWFEENGGW